MVRTPCNKELKGDEHSEAIPANASNLTALRGCSLNFRSSSSPQNTA
jgi:hypothetical protein